VGALVGVPIALHGADVLGTGIGQLINGQPADTLTSGFLQSAGLSQQNANFVDMSLSMLGSMGGGAVLEGAAAVAESEAGASALTQLLGGDATAFNNLSSEAQSLAIAEATSQGGELAQALGELPAVTEGGGAAGTLFSSAGGSAGLNFLRPAAEGEHGKGVISHYRKNMKYAAGDRESLMPTGNRFPNPAANLARDLDRSGGVRGFGDAGIGIMIRICFRRAGSGRR
jgi:hypothetical protein